MPLRRARRAVRRTARRTVRRATRRHRRRVVVAGGMVLLVGAAAATVVKLTKKDAQTIEKHTGQSAEEMTDQELVAAMKELGIKSLELDDSDKAAAKAAS